MMPQTHASTRTPAWPGVGRGGLPEPCGPTADRDRRAWYIFGRCRWRARARGPESEKSELARATQMRQAWGSGDLPSK